MVDSCNVTNVLRCLLKQNWDFFSETTIITGAFAMYDFRPKTVTS